MKTLLLAGCAAAALWSAPVQAQNLVVNGDFETGKGKFFNMTPPWYNRGTGFNQGVNARTDTGVVIGGTYSATINDRYNQAESKFGPVAHTQKTDYALKEGDTFAVSYEWLPVDEHWQKNRDTVRFVLYATSDDKMNGTVLWSSTLTSDFFTANYGNPKTVRQKSEPVVAAAVGKRLFVTFHGVDTVDGVGGNTHYARVDNIVITPSRPPAPPKP